MKTTIIFTAMIFLLIVASESQAGIAGVITALKGECEAADENGVRFCSDRETGRIYYVYEGIAFNSYPDLKKD